MFVRYDILRHSLQNNELCMTRSMSYLYYTITGVDVREGLVYNPYQRDLGMHGDPTNGLYAEGCAHIPQDHVLHQQYGSGRVSGVQDQ